MSAVAQEYKRKYLLTHANKTLAATTIKEIFSLEDKERNAKEEEK